MRLKNKMIYYLYQYTHKANGKSYIGITYRISKRHKEHTKCHYKKNVTDAFHRAIKKYGIDAFNFRILAYLDNIAEAARIEHEAIISFGTLSPNGYNLISGEVGTEYAGPMSPELKLKLSKMFSGELNPSYGKPMSEDNKRKLIESHKGKKQTEEHRRKITETLIKRRKILSPEEIERKKITTKERRKAYGKAKREESKRLHGPRPERSSWNKGKHPVSSRKGKHTGQVPWNKGKKMTDEYCQIVSIAKKGTVPWNKGKRASLKNQLKLNI